MVCSGDCDPRWYAVGIAIHAGGEDRRQTALGGSGGSRLTVIDPAPHLYRDTGAHLRYVISRTQDNFRRPPPSALPSPRHHPL